MPTHTRRFTWTLCIALAAATSLSACTSDDDAARDAPPRPASTDAPVVEDAGPIHVHALGVNPADDAVFLATHTGLFRLARPGKAATRVADRWQDTMGFTVVGPNRFLASGHPDGREDLPAFLGLIESKDAGGTWHEVSLQGTMDFHVLEVSGDRIYGFGSEWDTRTDRLLVSNNGGETWWRRTVPEPLVDLAIAPADPDRAVAAGTGGLYLTRDGGVRWRNLPGEAALLAWSGRTLIALDRRGTVAAASGDGLAAWRPRGRVGGEPAALAVGRASELYVALHDGTVKRSLDGGRSWAPWYGPATDRSPAGTSDPGSVAPGPASRTAARERASRDHGALRDVPDDVVAK